MKRAAWLVALVALAQSPADVLEEARDRILAKTAQLPKSVCTETLDRSYFSRSNAPDSPTCEQIGIDRKRGKNKLRLEKTDRVRVAVALTRNREIYLWTGNDPASYSVEDILHPGPIGTGAFAGHLLDIFSNPSVRFRLLEEKPETIEYAFRVPVEASSYVVWAGGEWVPTGYNGAFMISSHDIRRLMVETNELPPGTSMCEASHAIEFGGGLVPDKSVSHDVMRDASETDTVTAISDCREAPAASHVVANPGTPLAAGIELSLAFDAPIDSAVAAAGDAISATITDAYLEGKKGSADLLWLHGATVRGRIVRMEHRTGYFVISVAFETVEVKGVVSPFYAKLIHRPPFDTLVVPEKSSHPPPAGHGRMDWSSTFTIRSKDSSYVLRPQVESKWLTTAPDAVQ